MKIKYSKRETKNLGNYENVTVEISAEDHVDTMIESKEECFLRLQNFVTTKLNSQFSSNLTNNESDNKLDIEIVKNKLVSLINKDEKNRGIVKDILKSYNATKLQDLSLSNLEEFNLKLEKL